MLNEETKVAIRDAYRNLSKNIEGFKPRRGQAEMISHIARTLDPDDTLNTHICVIEGQTGTGKSIGYMIGAIPVAQKLEKHLVISTATVALQEQLANKDLPMVAEKANLDFTYQIAKGRKRYVCSRNLAQLTGSNANQDALDFGEEHQGSAHWHRPPKDGEVEQVVRMEQSLTAGVWNGDLDELKEGIDDDLKGMVTTSNAGCSGRACSHYQDCPFYLARQDLKQADVIVTNHDFVLSDLELGGGVLLPEPEDTIYVFDEAHHLPDKAIGHFAYLTRIKGSIKTLESLSKSCNSGAVIMSDEKLKQKAREVKEIAQIAKNDLIAMRSTLETSFPSEQKGKFQTQTKEKYWRFEDGKTPLEFCDPGKSIAVSTAKMLQHGQEILEKLRKAIREKSVANEAGDRILQDLGNDIERATEIVDTWQYWSTPETDGKVPMARWVHMDDNGEIGVAVSAISAANMLRTMLWDKAYGAVLTSATITALNSFDRFRRSSGLRTNDGTSYLRIPSPFDYQNNGELEIPSIQAEPSDNERHTREVVDYIERNLNLKTGSLVLFASAYQMRQVHKALPEAIAKKCLVQGDLPKGEILKRHYEAVNGGYGSCIFGLASFAEGIDLPGDLCRHVVIAKLPFAVPGTPIEEARSEWLQKNGRNPFIEISVPDASLKLIQAVGRLIRTETDTGRVTILDKRLITKRYGKQLLDALPPLKRVTGPCQQQKTA
ncbi:ATP-dependent DNA helicase DinG [Marinobacter sp. P4B1]|uniref:ATP-dependent DNA helicase DinG n=1 Tax=Marinobacter sp. P4B1 TaxID=1119533 RepID=UPI00071D3A45|nr:ATP-dependent DNA helicase DinG [Marinobacter sp. P4B1]KRW83723.1 hypothetical protein AQ621_16875 [Marinobacter sp. P4B1]